MHPPPSTMITRSEVVAGRYGWMMWARWASAMRAAVPDWAAVVLMSAPSRVVAGHAVCRRPSRIQCADHIVVHLRLPNLPQRGQLVHRALVPVDPQVGHRPR